MGKKQNTQCLAYLLITFLIHSTLFAQESDKILGKWLNEEQDATVEVYKKGDNYYGKIVWLEDSSYSDDFNPDPTLRERKVLGVNILQAFNYISGENAWQNGTIYNPRNGKTYSCKMWLNKNGSLSIRGFVGFSFLGKTTTWTRPAKDHACYRPGRKAG